MKKSIDRLSLASTDPLGHTADGVLTTKAGGAKEFLEIVGVGGEATKVPIQPLLLTVDVFWSTWLYHWWLRQQVHPVGGTRVASPPPPALATYSVV